MVSSTVGLADEDRLEAAFQGGIFFDVLAIFVERGRADAAELAAGQRRLEQIGGVGGPFGSAGADHGVQFVDEQNHAAGGRFHFAQHGFQAVFKFAAVFCAGDERAEIERDDPLVFQAFGHVALHDAQCQPFGDGGFADAGLADQHRIVFRAAREHLDDAADFLIAADHRIELALPRAVDQIDAVFLQRLEFALRSLIGHAGRAADGVHRFEQFFFGDGIQLENVFALWNRPSSSASSRCSVETKSSFIVPASCWADFENLAQRMAEPTAARQRR